VPRTLLVGADGRTPIATVETIKKEAEELLLIAFGLCSGLAAKGATSQEEANGLGQASRMRILLGVLELEGMKPKIEERWGVLVRLAPDGELLIKDRTATRANPYG
jgi:hypothetical protein